MPGRIDFWEDSNTLPSVNVVVTYAGGEISLIHRSDNDNWGCHFLCPRLPSESYGPFLIPACFHHGIPLTKGGADVPLGAGLPGSPGGGCMT